LAGVKSWVAKGYETNTMPGWAGSSWYYLRYMDPKNKKELAGKKEIEYWQQVDIYVGGTEHATGHLLYARFWNKFLHDLEITPTEEPFKELHNQGMIIASDGRRMSKRWGNVVNPDDIVKTYGADTLRVYEMFMGPFTDSIAWSTESIIGPRRFLEKVWRVAQRLQINTDKKLINTDKIGENQSRNQSKSVDFSVEKLLHKTIKKVTEDIEAMRFNTAISSMMIFVNALDAEHTRKDAQIDIGNWVLFLKLNLEANAKQRTDGKTQALQASHQKGESPAPEAPRRHRGRPARPRRSRRRPRRARAARSRPGVGRRGGPRRRP